MTTRYEFGYGEGEIYRRRERGRKEMRRRMEESWREFPEEDRKRLQYESDYYGFRGAGRRSSYAAEYQVQPRRPSTERGAGRGPQGSRMPRGWRRR